MRPSCVPVFTGWRGGLAAALNSCPVLTGCLQNSLIGWARFSQRRLVSSGSSFSSSVAVSVVSMVGNVSWICFMGVLVCLLYFS